MKLKSLLKNIDVIEIIGKTNIEISSLSQTIDEKNENGIFFCYKGVNVDNHNFFQNAENMGAVVLVVERFLPTKTTQILVKDTRKVIGKICDNFYGNPAEKLKIIGISGTNGKTTSSYMFSSILSKAKKKVGIIGTNGVYVNGKFIPSLLTTPDPIKLYQLFNMMVDREVEWVVMEVSAHALDLSKVEGIVFELALFTNLTQDHLDYFKNMETYANAKQKLFTKRFAKKCVFNVDSSWGKEFTEKCDAEFLTYGIMCEADVSAENLNMSFSGSNFTVKTKDVSFDAEQNIVGKFNVYNALGVIASCLFIGLPIDAILSGLRSLKGVAGRFELVSRKPCDVIIDFAHTPDGLENVLKTAKALVKGKIYCIFGCGGNRDAGKRAKMGLISTIYSDFVIVTSDNPRFEKPQKIMEDIMSDMENKSNVYGIEDRQEAIIFALKTAQKDDVVLICGKGAEDYQEIDGVKYPFSDKDIVYKYVKNKIDNN